MPQPIYLTVGSTNTSISSTGSSPWFQCNVRGIADFNIGLSLKIVATLSASAWVDVTMDDPFGLYPNPSGTTVFLSSQVGTFATTTSTSIGAITTPVYALRLTTNSTGGMAVLTVLQNG